MALKGIKTLTSILITWQVSATYHDGFRATAVSPVVGPHAAAKGERVAESIILRF